MTQPTNLQKAIEAAKEKWTNDSNGMTTLDFIDEIVTSTYLKAVEDCVKILEVKKEQYPGFYYNEAIEELQSLKQTDV